MKNPKSTTLIGLASIGLILLALKTEQGVSQQAPPLQAQSFASHFSELTVAMPAGGFDEEGAVPGTGQFQLPVLNRTVRISITFTANDGEISFGQTVACYSSSRGECGFQEGSAGASVTAGFFLLRLRESVLAIVLSGEDETDGRIDVLNFHTAPGSLKVAFWY